MVLAVGNDSQVEGLFQPTMIFQNISNVGKHPAIRSEIYILNAIFFYHWRCHQTVLITLVVYIFKIFLDILPSLYKNTFTY